MTIENFEFDKKNRVKLLRIADLCKVVAWIVLIAFTGLAAATYLKAMQEAIFNVVTTKIFTPGEFFEMLSKNPAYAIKLYLEMLTEIMRGVVYWLVLRAVSVGLSMIVEMNFNNPTHWNGLNYER